MKKKAIIISGNQAQDHEFIYPFYRLLEEEFEVEIPDDAAENIQSFGDAVKFIEDAS